MKKMIVAVLGIALLATSGLALAQGWGRGGVWVLDQAAEWALDLVRPT